MRQSIGELNGGWKFLLQLFLVLSPLILSSQLWLARTIWVLDTKVSDMVNHVEELRGEIASINNRVSLLERKP